MSTNVAINETEQPAVMKEQRLFHYWGKLTERHPTIAAFGRVLSASITAKIFTVARGLIIAKLVAPEVFGISGTIAIILAYAQYADLGTSNAASREITEALGKGEPQDAKRAASWLSGLKLISIAAVTLVVLAISRLPHLEPSMRLSLTVFPAIAFPSIILNIVLTQWYAQSRTKEFSRATTIAAATDFALGVTLTWIWGLTGLLTASALAPAATFVWSLTNGNITFPALPPIKVIKRYLIIGLPFIALALIDHNLIYIDQLIVLRYFSVREVGLYNIALMATEVVRMISIATGVVVGPRLIREYAQSGGNIESIREITFKPIRLHALIVPFAIAGLWIIGGFLITRFYPKYIESLRPMHILLLAFYFLVVNAGVTTFLFAINKHYRNLYIITPSLIFNVIIDLVLIRLGYGILSIALGSLLTYILYSMTHIGYVISHFRMALKEKVGFYGEWLFPIIYLSMVLFIVEKFFTYRSSAQGAIIAFLVSYFLLIPLAIRGGLISGKRKGLYDESSKD
ncbi:MAG: hypothetical protein AB1757_30700 [Acidobacteriota bacterium]